jgi:murein DD-endopeptidase MepM/ murein hydrolase activator NlpD
MAFTGQIIRATGLSVSLLALASCADFDGDFRDLGGGVDTSAAALSATAQRPDPDSRGLITYSSYQVAIARRGDTVSDVANRVGVSAAELASYNGIRDGVPLRSGETLVLPSGASTAGGGTDITAIAGAAIERADGGRGVETQVLEPAGQANEPQRHRVAAGETAFSIARTYGVTPRALAEWNGLGSDYAVREGQILLIPVAIETAAASPAAAPVAATTLPGSGTVAPEPPSAAAPLPVEETPSAPVPAPEPQSMAEERTEESELLMPVSGNIIRAYEKDKNNGIDIAASSGADVRAAADGTVAAISRDTSGILAVVVRHPGDLLTVYFGVEDETVSKDDRVSRGQVIGKVRDDDPSFLHFEVRRGFEPLDPEPFLN